MPQLLERIFGWILSTSWKASVLALVVLLVQAAFGKRLNPRWRYALWLLVILRLVSPWEPESSLSLFQSGLRPSAAIVMPVSEPLFTHTPEAAPLAHAPVPERSRNVSFRALMAFAWLAGAVSVLLILTAYVNYRFTVRIRNLPRISDPGLLSLLERAKADLGIRRPIRLVENTQIASPAIMGLVPTGAASARRSTGSIRCGGIASHFFARAGAS